MKVKDISNEHEWQTAILKIIHRLTAHYLPFFWSFATWDKKYFNSNDLTGFKIPQWNILPLEHALSNFVTTTVTKINIEREKTQETWTI